MKTDVKTYYLITFFSNISISFFFATYAVFLTQKGMNLAQLGIIASMSWITATLFQIPTGAFADAFGRKTSIVIGFFTTSIGTAIYFFSAGFWDFIAAEVIAGLGMVFISGAIEAWIVDSLKSRKYEIRLNEVFGKGTQYGQAGIIIGSLTGAYLGSLKIEFPWLAASIGNFALALLSLAIVRENNVEVRRTRKGRFSELKNIAIDGTKYALKNKSIMYVVIFSAIFVFTTKPFDIQWSIVFKNTYNTEVSYLGGFSRAYRCVCF